MLFRPTDTPGPPLAGLHSLEVPCFEETLAMIDFATNLLPSYVYIFNNVTKRNEFTNRSLALFLGVTARGLEHFGDRVFLRFIHPDDIPKMHQKIVEILALDGDTSITTEYRILTAEGDERWMRSVDKVFDRTADGAVQRHIGCASDITAEKMAELHIVHLNVELENKIIQRTDALANLNAELEQRITARTSELQNVVEELEQLTYIATHDLKVPTNNLCRLGRMLEEDAETLSDDQRELVEWINSCTVQLNDKIEGLVRVAEISRSCGINHEAIKLRDAVEDALKIYEPDLRMASAIVSVDIPDSIQVEYSTFEVSNILETLVSNALSYAEPSRILKVNFRSGLEGGMKTLRVTDNGTGLNLPQDNIKVFGLFQRAHVEPAGSGIGLYCARRILQRRGGSMTVSGEKGIGAEFTIIFPSKGAE